MKLLICSANYAPEMTGIGKYSGEMAVWLAHRGHDVRVVAAPPYYPEWRVADSHRGRGFCREFIDGVKVWRAPVWVPAAPGGLKRVLHLLSFAATSFVPMLMQVFWKPDVVLVVAPAFVCAPAGLLTARLSGARAWLHVQDFEVDVAFSQGLLAGRRLRALVGGIERWLFRRFERVSTISHRMLACAQAKGVVESDLMYFPNWVDTDAIKPVPGLGSNYRRELGIPADAVVALFSGSFGRKQGLMLLPAVARRLVHMPKLVFVICGGGVMQAELKAACAGLGNVRLLSLQPSARLGDLLGMADIHLLPQSAEASDLVMPSKLCGMLASGRPVVATSGPDTEIAVVLNGCGVVVAPDDEEAFADAIAALAADPARRAKLGGQARQRAENELDTTAVLTAFEDALYGLSRRRKNAERPQHG